MACYYCGRIDKFVCDLIVPSLPGGQCSRQCCAKCCVPEFEDGKREDFALCKDHAHLQASRDVPCAMILADGTVYRGETYPKLSQ
jgi:hypothetical protein